MRYQITFENNLHIYYDTIPSMKSLSFHFACNGYDPVYVYCNNCLSMVITYDDFVRRRFIRNINRTFIKEYTGDLNRQKIERDFCSALDSDRLVYIAEGRVVCEINSLVELPLLNSIAKNIIALRYICFFKSELYQYLNAYKNVLIISNLDIYEYISSMFPKINFVFAEDYDSVCSWIERNEIDLVLDFLFGKKIRKVLRIFTDKVVELSKILTPFALEKLKFLAANRGIKLLFYKLPRVNDLSCLNIREKENYKNKKSIGELLQDSFYVYEFGRSQNEVIYLKNRGYHSSQRIDNGYCFIMDESSNNNHRVHNGIRANGDTIVAQEAIIYNFYGPCAAYGFLVSDNFTITSLVEKLAQKDGLHLQVNNRAGIHGFNELNSIMEALLVPVTTGDAHVFLEMFDELPIDSYPNMGFVKDLFNERKSKDEIQFLDYPEHCNSVSNKIMAEYIYDDIKNIETKIRNDMGKASRQPLLEYSIGDLDILAMTHSAYIKQKRIINRKVVNKNVRGCIGFVVMPNNIEYDLAMFYIQRCKDECDFLYVFFSNANIEEVNDCKRIYDACESMSDVLSIQLEYFFDVNRYYGCYQKALFTEQVFSDMCKRYLKINIRFLLHYKDCFWWNDIVLASGNNAFVELKEIL